MVRIFLAIYIFYLKMAYSFQKTQLVHLFTEYIFLEMPEWLKRCCEIPFASVSSQPWSLMSTLRG